MTGHHIRPWTEPRIGATLDHVHHRATITPTLTAVRYHSDAVTYEDLAAAMHAYDDVSERQGLGMGASLVSAVMHCLPRIRTLGDPASVASAVTQVVEWLARDLPEEGTPQLRAVG